MYLVSILVPIYGVEKYIERCARSVFDQTYPNLEFLFCNDSTPDNSMEILGRVIDDYPHLHERIHILHHDHNQGIGATRNTLLDHCTGEFLTHVHSDDWIEPNMLERLVKRQQETDADILTGGVFNHKANGEVITIKPYEHEYSREEALLAILERRTNMTIWRRLIRTKLFLENSIRCIEGINMSEDASVTPKLFYYAKSVTKLPLPAIYHYYHINPNSYMTRYQHDWSLQMDSLTVFRMLAEFFDDKKEPFREAMRKSLVKHCYVNLIKNCRNLNHNGYNYILSLLNDTDSKYWPLIGWDKKRKRWLDHHYYINYLTLPLRRIKRKISKISILTHKSPEQP